MVTSTTRDHAHRSKCQTIRAPLALPSCHCRYDIAYPRCHRPTSSAHAPLLPKPPPPPPPPGAASLHRQKHSTIAPLTLPIPTHLSRTTKTSELQHHLRQTLASPSAPQAVKPAISAPLASCSLPRRSDNMPSPPNSHLTAAPPSALSTCAEPP